MTLYTDTQIILKVFSVLLSVNMLTWAEYHSTEESAADARELFKRHPYDTKITNRYAYIMPDSNSKEYSDVLRRLKSSFICNETINGLLPLATGNQDSSIKAAAISKMCTIKAFAKRYQKYKAAT